MNNDKKHIESLLNLFMQGETTIEQERELRQFFASSYSVLEEWEPYKEMMAYFDDGMPLEVVNNQRRKISRPVCVLVAAAVAAIIIMVLPNLRYSPQTESQKVPPVITTKEDTPKTSDSISVPMDTQKPLMAKVEKETVDNVPLEPKNLDKKHEPKRTMPSKVPLDPVEVEREKGEIEQAQQELLADKFIIEQERQEILEEQYLGRVQAYQAQQAIAYENPQFIQVVFK